MLVLEGMLSIREATKLSGIIFKKADMEKNFERVYTKVFEDMVKVNLGSEIHILEVLGDVGG